MLRRRYNIPAMKIAGTMTSALHFLSGHERKNSGTKHLARGAGCRISPLPSRTQNPHPKRGVLQEVSPLSARSVTLTLNFPFPTHRFIHRSTLSNLSPKIHATQASASKNHSPLLRLPPSLFFVSRCDASCFDHSWNGGQTTTFLLAPLPAGAACPAEPPSAPSLQDLKKTAGTPGSIFWLITLPWPWVIPLPLPSVHLQCSSEYLIPKI